MASPNPNQLQGFVKFGVSAADTDVSNDVFACTFTKTFDGIERPASFGSGRKTTVAGNFSETLVVSFANDGTNATAGTLSALISSAVFAATPSTLLNWEFRQTTDPISSTNPRISGTCSVLEAMKGGEVGTFRKQDATFPVLTSTISNT